MTAENEAYRDEPACIRLELCCDKYPEQNSCLQKQNGTTGKEDLLCISTFKANIAEVKSCSHPYPDAAGWYTETEEAAIISLASRRQECLGDSSRPTQGAQGTLGFSSRTAESRR